MVSRAYAHAPMFTMSGCAKTKSRSPNQRHAIRSKNLFWRAAMRREAGGHENFFIAKNRDSESAQRAFGRHWRGAMTSFTHRSLNASITKTSAAQAFYATSAIVGTGFRAPFASLRQWFMVLPINARRALSPRRVNTSLSGTLFF
jgi:hypothetical protein